MQITNRRAEDSEHQPDNFQCPECNGSGVAWGDQDCSYCLGTGTVTEQDYNDWKPYDPTQI